MRAIIAIILGVACSCPGGCGAFARIDGGMRHVQPSIVNGTGAPLDVEYASSNSQVHCRVVVAAGGAFAEEALPIFPPSKSEWPRATLRQNGQEVRIAFGPKGWDTDSTDRYEAKLIDGRLTISPQR